MERREVHFVGHVQGVGFRYSVHRLAGNHSVTGFVRNLPNGQVQLLVEGSPAEIDQFVSQIEGAMSGYIQETKQSRLAATGEFTDFTIRH